MTDKQKIETIESPYISAVDHKNFSKLVLENSEFGPVLVNFWSRKAGQCLRQYPVLDKVIHGYKGRVLLVNIDIDHEFIITKQYGITSVPTLKLFRNSNVVETRHGYQSENDLIKMLDVYIARDSDSVLTKAIHRYAQGDNEAAYQIIAEAIETDPENPRLPLAMCKMLKHEKRYKDALALFESLPVTIRQYNDIDQLYQLLLFYQTIDPQQETAQLVERLTLNPDDLDARLQMVAHHAIQMEYTEALQQLVEMMDIDQSFHDNFAQKAMLGLFNIIGSGDPLITQFRGNLRRYSH